MPPEPTPVVEAQALTRSAGGRPILSGLSFGIARGEIVALLGLNGAGKSTALKLLAGVLVPDTGSVSVSGHSLQDAPLAARARIGYLPDQPPLFDDMRVEPYLAFCARLRRVPRPELDARVTAALADWDLVEVRRRRIARLSKGFRQRLGLAQALVHRPDLLVLDEPANGLDPEQMAQMRTRLQQAAGHGAVIFSTHLLAEAEAVCNRVLILHEGQLLADQAVDTQGEQLRSLFSELVTGSSPTAARAGVS